MEKITKKELKEILGVKDLSDEELEKVSGGVDLYSPEDVSCEKGTVASTDEAGMKICVPIGA